MAITKTGATRNRKKKAVHYYSSDRAIRSKKQDILGRAKFAARLASDIRAWSGNDSLVIALYGAWGVGKTSVKNMLLEANHENGTPLRVVDFNFWGLSRTGNIPASFFRELGIVLRKEGPKHDIEKRAQKWDAYASMLTLAGSTAQWVGKVLPFTGTPGGPVLESVGKGMKSASTSLKEGSDALKAQAKASVKSLEEQKQELADLLELLPQPLLVVIDDIERLTTDEILQVFQLVKANADFPHLIYLLLFEREIVAKALNQISGDKGSEFLEKIIQVGYHVPPASPAAIQKVLFEGIDKFLENSPASKYWDANRWRNLYIDGLASYFKNLRHVYRFLSSLSFHVQHHRTANSFEVNPIDLIGLEVLRVFEPSIYERLPGAKTILIRYEGQKIHSGVNQDIVNQAVEQIISTATSESRDRVKAILHALFPISSTYSDRRAVSGYHQEWLRGLRICHPGLFEKYFTLTISDDDLSQTELDDLLQSTANIQGFMNRYEALNRRGLLKIAFDRLDAYKEHIPLSNMPALIEALCNLSDNFPARSPSFLETDIETLASRLIYFGLKREPDTKKRFQILREALTRSTGLLLPAQIVSLNERVANREEKGYEFLVEESELVLLMNICVEKFRLASKTPEFRANPHLETFLWQWSNWSTLDEVRTWLSTHAETTKGAIWLLTVFVGEIHSWGQEHKVSYHINLSSMERFSDVAKLTSLLKEVKEGKLAEHERRAIRAFRKALKRRAEGKPDHASPRDHDDAEALDD